MTINETCGQSAIAFLEAHGVDTVFGIPGVHTLDFYKGLSNSRIRHIGVRHEQGAGFMADGYARASGKPGVCVLITGPGVVNAGTAIGQAFSDSVPMLVLSSVNGSEDLGKGRGRLHEITDQQAVMAPLTAFSRTILKPDELTQAMADAYAVFETGRPRPVHIEIPIDVLAGQGVSAVDTRGRRQRPVAEPAALSEAARLIDGAKRLVVIAGGGALEAGDTLKTFVEKSGAVLIPTVAGRGILRRSSAEPGWNTGARSNAEAAGRKRCRGRRRDRTGGDRSLDQTPADQRQADPHRSRSAHIDA
jgi:5-guanidino-2-oxopentanoate decarboxylase